MSRKFRSLFRLSGAVVVLSVGLTVLGGGAADALTVNTTATGTSCVTSAEGWNGTSGLTFAAGDVFKLHAKCYYDPAGGSSTGAIGPILGTDTTAPACLSFVYGGSSSTVFYRTDFANGAAAAGGYSVGLLSLMTGWTVNNASTGYVEFTMTGTVAASGPSFIFNGSGQRAYKSYRNNSTTSCGTVWRSLSDSVPASAQSDVAYSGWATAEPIYRWGAAFVADPCTQFSYTITPPVMDRGAVAHVITSTSVDPPVPVAISIRFRPLDPWQDLFSLLPGGVPPFVSGGSWPAHAFRVVPDGLTTSPANAEYRCTNSAGDVRYTLPGTTIYGTVQGEDRACNRGQIHWPSSVSRFAVSAAVPFWYSMTGSGAIDSTVAIAYTTYDPNASAVFNANTATWTAIPSWSLSTVHDLINVSLSAVYAGSATQFHFRCTDAQGVSYGGFYDPAVGLTYQSPVTSADCYSTVDLGINPGTWVPYLLRGMACLGQTLFVPSQADLDYLTASASAINTKEPVHYITETISGVVALATGSADAVAAHHNDCLSLFKLYGEATVRTACPSVLDAANPQSSFGAYGQGTTPGANPRAIMGYLELISGAYLMFVCTIRVIKR